MKKNGIPTACETDIYGALSMLIQFASTLEKNPPHFMDWTIKHQEKENIFMTFHCGNAPISLCSKSSKPLLREHFIFSNTLGLQNSCGTCEFQLKEGIMSFNRLTELDGDFKILTTKGEVLRDQRKLRGSWAWIKVDDLDRLYKKIIDEGFTHHASSIFGDITKEIEIFCKFSGIKAIYV